MDKLLRATNEYIRPHLILILLILLGLSIRIPLVFDTGIFYDEGVLLYKALAVSDGEALYVDIGDNRTPLVTGVLALLLKLPFFDGGASTLVAFRFAFVLLFVLTTFFVYALSKTIFNRKVGLIAVAFFIFEPLLIGQSIQVVPEIPALCFTVIGAYFLTRAMTQDTPGNYLLLGSGFFLCLALLSHQYAVLPILSMGLYFLITGTRFRASFGDLKERVIRPATYIGLGALAPAAACGILLYVTGSWNGFVDSIGPAAETSKTWDTVDMGEKYRYLRYAIVHASTIAIWLLGFGQVVFFFIRPKRACALLPIWFTTTLLLTLFLPQSLGYPINYIWVIPPLSLLAANATYVLVVQAKRPAFQ